LRAKSLTGFSCFNGRMFWRSNLRKEASHDEPNTRRLINLDTTTIAEAHGRRGILAPFQGADETTQTPGVSSQGWLPKPATSKFPEKRRSLREMGSQPPATFWQPFGLFCDGSVERHSPGSPCREIH